VGCSSSLFFEEFRVFSAAEIKITRSRDFYDDSVRLTFCSAQQKEPPMSSVTTVCRGEKLGTINAILEEHGCIVIENMLDQARHEALEARIRPLLDATAPCQGNFYGFATSA
jgi:hypothetical protein